MLLRPWWRLLLMGELRGLLRLRPKLRALRLARSRPTPVRRSLRRPRRGWRRLARQHGGGLCGLRLGLGRLPLKLGLDVVGGRHERDIGHGLRLEPDHACIDLGIDAPQERPNIEVEKRPVSRHHAIGLRPRRQGIERALLQRLDHLGAGCELGSEICFRQSARGAKIPE